MKYFIAFPMVILTPSTHLANAKFSWTTFFNSILFWHQVLRLKVLYGLGHFQSFYCSPTFTHLRVYVEAIQCSFPCLLVENEKGLSALELRLPKINLQLSIVEQTFSHNLKSFCLFEYEGVEKLLCSYLSRWATAYTKCITNSLRVKETRCFALSRD